MTTGTNGKAVDVAPGREGVALGAGGVVPEGEGVVSVINRAEKEGTGHKRDNQNGLKTSFFFTSYAIHFLAKCDGVYI